MIEPPSKKNSVSDKTKYLTLLMSNITTCVTTRVGFVDIRITIKTN